MKRVCRVTVFVLAGLYILALALFAIGTLGLFGSERDPLAAVFLVPLGLPWNLMLEVFPDPALPWLGASAPLVNLFLLLFVCRLIRARR